ncbi:beta-galactosidase [Mucilaginibacter sp.]|jgi:beta-galactosidase|uniref:beta-galactosidase n=1 Tax=Mucilaginibacter sp. TaxID=1882438 RepID=UPI002BC88E12|nr:beta-galactosidase [Mucilaginibacter sp.]HTI58417.1 beta-galactosidase [Mucilaginibacter sp.]
MNKRFWLSLLTLILLASAVRGQSSNDHIFPAAPAAKSGIDFDSKGFLIHGKRTFIVSAGMEYARVPHQLWYDRLLRIKRAGFNCVEIYTFWNFHEPREGQFDFTGDHDLGLFLATVKKLGMYVIVRVGPYYCAEWDNGGYPLWLKFKKGLGVREDNKVFEYYVDRFFDKLLPIVFKNQVNRGGAVILVQLENEHTQGWGTVIPNGYFKHLQAKALSLGLQVPYFFSGLHHSSDPAADGKPDDPKRPNPWFSTEFWSVWYSQYGPKPEDAGIYDRRTWKIIAHGGNGYNYYMAHGGSNFGYTNNDEDAASYDYGAAIGQAGDLRPIYYTFKRAAWFARSFQDILENSTDATPAYSKMTPDTAIKVSARTSPSGDIVFLDNPGKNLVNAKLQQSGVTINVASGEIYPLVHNFRIGSGITLDWAYTRIFAIVKQRNTTTIITDCEKGADLSLHFTVVAGMMPKSGSPGIKITGNKVDLDAAMQDSDRPSEYAFTAGTQTIRVLAMDRQGTDKTSITGNAGENYIISGASYVGGIIVKDQNIRIETETPLPGDHAGPVWLYTANKALRLGKGDGARVSQPQKLKLTEWMQSDASAPALPGFSVGNWLHSKTPLQMGADGDLSPDAWYRTMVTVPATGNYTMQVKGSGRGQAYIDGKPAAKWKLDDGEVSLNLKKGRHALAVFTAHDGRDKLAGYIGPIVNVDNKGIFGTAFIKQGGPFISRLNNWYFVSADHKDDARSGPPKFDTTHYKKYKIGDDVFNKREGYGWFETTIAQPPAGTSKIILSFRSVDESATVFINGKQVYHHDGWNDPFEVTVSDPEALKAPLRLNVFVENYSNEGGIDQPVKVNTIGDAAMINDWAMKGGIDNSPAAKKWVALSAEDHAGPYFYHTKFTVHFSASHTFIWRVDTKNMGHGSVWVNGHNLGRYPEKVDAPGVYIPECWLRDGANELLIYDEDGKSANGLNVIAEPAAGRTTVILTANIK